MTVRQLCSDTSLADCSHPLSYPRIYHVNSLICSVAWTVFFLLEGNVQQTTEMLELEGDSQEPIHDAVMHKPHAQLMVKWEYGGLDSADDAISGDSALHGVFSEMAESPAMYSAFRRELNSIHGIFKPESRYNPRTSYRQTRSEAQAELEQQTGTQQDVEDPWILEFDQGTLARTSSSELSPTHEEGQWILYNSKLRGKSYSWDEKTQLPWRPPLGGHSGSETMWKWQWQDDNQEKHGLIPDKYLPLMCVVFVEVVSPPLCFGELEMMRIGGGVSGKIRTMTARAMTESRMCLLSAESFEALRAIYPQHMGNNRDFALRKADKKDPRLRVSRNTSSEPQQIGFTPKKDRQPLRDSSKPLTLGLSSSSSPAAGGGGAQLDAGSASVVEGMAAGLEAQLAAMASSFPGLAGKSAEERAAVMAELGRRAHEAIDRAVTTVPKPSPARQP
eukprot:COSAG06_NODE_1840_length_8239_cov_3.113145_10_plen_446_part_00